MQKHKKKNILKILGERFNYNSNGKSLCCHSYLSRKYVKVYMRVFVCVLRNSS